MTRDLPAILGGPAIRPSGPPDWPFPDEFVTARIQQALADGSWGRYHGPRCAELTARLADYHQIEHVFLCASGTAAVELALRGLGIGPGDEVILSAYDFRGNFQDILVVGATPVLVDPLPGNFNLDPARLPAAITPRTKAVLVSHLHGGVVDMPEVVRMARDFKVSVIEDAAQAPGATIHGRVAGTWGDAAILSFGGSKLVTAGRGGALLTGRADIAQRVRRYTQRGNDAYPLSELQAAAILPQWNKLDAANAHRRAAADWLASRLESVGGLRPFVNAPSDSRPVYYKFGLGYESEVLDGLERDAFAAAVRAEGIALDAGFRALHLSHAARRFHTSDKLPVATSADARVLTLHHPVLLGTEEDWAEFIAAITRVRAHAAEIREWFTSAQGSPLLRDMPD